MSNAASNQQVWIHGAVSFSGDAHYGVVHVHPWPEPTACPLATFTFTIRGNRHLDGRGAASRLASRVAAMRYRDLPITPAAVRAALVDIAERGLLPESAIESLLAT